MQKTPKKTPEGTKPRGRQPSDKPRTRPSSGRGRTANPWPPTGGKQ